MPGRAILETKNRSYVLYGRSGTGKTTLTCTFPKPLLLLDIRDEGTDSVADVEGVDARELSSFAEFEETYWWLKKHKKYKTVVVDTVSQLQNMAMREVAENNKKTGTIGDWGTFTKRDWGDVAAMLKEWLQNYRDLTRDGYDVVFVAQDRVFNFDEDDASGLGEIDPEVGPQLMPSVVKTLNASVSVIGNTFIRERIVVKEVRGKKTKKPKIEFGLRIGPSSVYVTKVRKPRSQIAPAYIIDPAYEDILEVIKGE